MKPTPGPWRTCGGGYSTHNHPSRYWDCSVLSDSGIVAAGKGATLAEAEANARLIAAAQDHAMVARVLTAGKARWEAATNEFCFDGLRHSTELDEFGVPRLTDHLRARLAKAEAE